MFFLKSRFWNPNCFCTLWWAINILWRMNRARELSKTIVNQRGDEWKRSTLIQPRVVWMLAPTENVKQGLNWNMLETYFVRKCLWKIILIKNIWTSRTTRSNEHEYCWGLWSRIRSQICFALSRIEHRLIIAHLQYLRMILSKKDKSGNVCIRWPLVPWHFTGLVLDFENFINNV